MYRPTRRTLTFYVLATISLALLALSASGRLAGLEGAMNSAARPFLLAASTVGRQVTELVNTARDLGTLRSRNEQLQTQTDTLAIDNLRLKEVEAENERLRRLLRFRQVNPAYDYRGGQIIARVTSSGPSNYLRTISIDLGAEHGIEPDMPVITERGLVGRIYKVGPKSSSVLLITDPISEIPALLQRNRATGVVGGIAGASPVMHYISQDADVSVGDLVITSGLGGNLPKNLVVGQIVEVRKRDYEMYQQAVVRPTVDFGSLEVVLVITNFAPLTGQPGTQDDAG